MKINSVKHLLLTVAALAVVARAHADFGITFVPADTNEWSGSFAYSAAGPSGWVGGSALQSTDTGGGWAQGSGMTINFSYSSGHQPNLWAMDATAAHLSFDLVVDGTSFNANAQWWNFIIAANSPGGWAQTQVTNGWQNAGDPSLRVYHIDLPFTALNWTPAVAAGSGWYQVNLWMQSDGGNPVDFYLDNVSAYTATSVRPTNDISKVTGPRGLILKTSTNVFIYDVGNEQYQRQNVRSATTGYAWLNSPDPLTYSLTITNYPDVAYSNFQTQVWLIDGAANANAPDYNNAHVVSLAINQNADGTANGHLAYKVNQPGGNAMFYAAGSLGDCFSTTVLGTWSITFTNNDYVVVTSPDGTIFSTNLTVGDSANFSQPLTIYIDSQAILTNNIGQQAVLSKFQVVSNSTTLLTDNFSSGALDGTKWLATQAEDPANVSQVPTTAAYKLTWSVPDGGFTLQATSDLLTWANPGFSTALIGGRRTAFVSDAYAATNNGKYFRLSNP